MELIYENMKGISTIVGILVISCSLCGCDWSGNKIQQPKESSHTENVNVSVEQKEPQYEYIGTVTGYSYEYNSVAEASFLDSTKELRLEKKGNEICVVVGDNRYHVSIGNYSFTVDHVTYKTTAHYNAKCTINGIHGGVFYFEY